MNAAAPFLVKLAAQSVAAWDALRAETFAGDARLYTGNSVYLFRDGVFVSCSRNGSSTPSDAMRGLRLIGFLVHEDGLWSLSSRYEPGAHAVLVRPGGRQPEGSMEDDDGSFVVTSAARDFQRDEIEPVPELDDSGIRRTDLPLRVRRPAPESVTRLHAHNAELTAKAG